MQKQKQVNRNLLLHPLAMEDDYAYLVRRWISLFSSFPIALGLYFLPGIILSFLLLFWVCFVICSFVCFEVCVCVCPQIVGNAGTMFRSFH